MSHVEENKRIVNEKRKMCSFHPKENAGLTFAFSLGIQHLHPNGVRDLKWQEFIREQLKEHRVASVREEIVNTGMTNALEKYCLEKTLFEFGSRCTRVVWLRLFDWVFPRLDPYWKCDSKGRPIHLIADVEPQPQLADAWISGNLSDIFVVKSSSLIATIPEAMLNDVDGNIMEQQRQPCQQRQQRQQRGNREREERGRTSKMKKTMTTTPIALASAELKEHLGTFRQSKRQSVSSAHKRSGEKDIAQDKGDLPRNLENSKVNVSEKIVKQSGHLRSDSKQQKDATNIRSTQNDKKDPQISEKESMIQYRRLSDRVEILYSILSERADHPEPSTSNGRRTN